ncbi:unnamed protein product [Moneuplotes crassus]|uniref:Uncharacterized protein n=1 Tax=Euplotes crassus TaxID=5936 RepID=A0AAD1X6Z6_EUPCR|nr:unnamed protein product [Moneuplotes crassus]
MGQKKSMKDKCGIKRFERSRVPILTLRVVIERGIEEKVPGEVFEDTQHLYLKEMCSLMYFLIQRAILYQVIRYQSLLLEKQYSQENLHDQEDLEQQTHNSPIKPQISDTKSISETESIRFNQNSLTTKRISFNHTPQEANNDISLSSSLAHNQHHLSTLEETKVDPNRKVSETTSEQSSFNLWPQICYLSQDFLTSIKNLEQLLSKISLLEKIDLPQEIRDLLGRSLELLDRLQITVRIILTFSQDFKIFSTDNLCDQKEQLKRKDHSIFANYTKRLESKIRLAEYKPLRFLRFSFDDEAYQSFIGGLHNKDNQNANVIRNSSRPDSSESRLGKFSKKPIASDLADSKHMNQPEDPSKEFDSVCIDSSICKSDNEISINLLSSTLSKKENQPGTYFYYCSSDSENQDLSDPESPLTD